MVSTIRSRAQGPLQASSEDDTKQFEVFSRTVWVKGKQLHFETIPLKHEELEKAQLEVSGLYEELIQNWSLIVGSSSIDELAPPHRT